MTSSTRLEGLALRREKPRTMLSGNPPAPVRTLLPLTTRPSPAAPGPAPYGVEGDPGDRGGWNRKPSR